MEPLNTNNYGKSFLFDLGVAFFVILEVIMIHIQQATISGG